MPAPVTVTDEPFLPGAALGLSEDRVFKAFLSDRRGPHLANVFALADELEDPAAKKGLLLAMHVLDKVLLPELHGKMLDKLRGQRMSWEPRELKLTGSSGTLAFVLAIVSFLLDKSLPTGMSFTGGVSA